MNKDIQDLFVLQMQQSNNKIISTFETMMFCFKSFENKLHVDLWGIIIAL
jgi:hypothetical protein